MFGVLLWVVNASMGTPSRLGETLYFDFPAVVCRTLSPACPPFLAVFSDHGSRLHYYKRKVH